MGLQFSHREARSLFLPYVDEDLPAPKAETLRSHLRDCGDCRQGFAQYLETVQALRGLKKERAPAGLSTHILRRIRWQSRIGAPRHQRMWAAAHPRTEGVVLVLVAAMAGLLYFLL